MSLLEQTFEQLKALPQQKSVSLRNDRYRKYFLGTSRKSLSQETG